MMSGVEDKTIYVCEACGEEVEPADSRVVRAAELVEVSTMGVGKQSLDGRTVLFHASCYPHDSQRYRLL
jgi:hypothetical protein